MKIIPQHGFSLHFSPVPALRTFPHHNFGVSHSFTTNGFFPYFNLWQKPLVVDESYRLLIFEEASSMARSTVLPSPSWWTLYSLFYLCIALTTSLRYISAGSPSKANSFKLASLQKKAWLKKKKCPAAVKAKSCWIDEIPVTYTPWPLNHARFINPCSSAVRFSSHLTWLDPCLCPAATVPCLCSNQHDRCSCSRPPSKLRRLLLTMLFCHFDI